MQLFLFLWLISIIVPVAFSGISKIGITEEEYMDITLPLLSKGEKALTPQEAADFSHNDLGVIKLDDKRETGYCGPISLLQSSIITIDDFEKGIIHQSNYIDKRDKSHSSYHIGNPVHLSHALKIDLDVTEFIVTNYQQGKWRNNIKKGLNAMQENLLKERKNLIDLGKINEDQWVQSVLKIPGHYLSVTMTNNGGMLIQNADILITSAAGAREPQGFFISYRPPLNGDTKKSKEEWTRINTKLNNGLQWKPSSWFKKDKTKYRDTFFEYLAYHFKPGRSNTKDFKMHLIGVTGSNHKPVNSKPASNKTPAFSYAMQNANQRNKYDGLFNRSIQVQNTGNAWKHNGVISNRFKVINSKSINRGIKELEKSRDLKKSSRAAQRAKKGTNKRYAHKSAANKMQRANASWKFKKNKIKSRTKSRR